MPFGYLAFALVLCASTVTCLDSNIETINEKVARSLLSQGKYIENTPASILRPSNRVRRARRRYEYGPGRPGGESGKTQIRLIALDYPVNASLKGTSGADQLCRNAAFTQRVSLNGTMWRAVVASRWRSLNSLLIYEAERKNARIVNRRGETLFKNWLDFQRGAVGEKNPILSFSGYRIEDRNISYAWFGYSEATTGNEPVTAQPLHPYCGSWMYAQRTNVGPALNLIGFKKSRTVNENVRNIACASQAALLCVEAKVPSSVVYSPFGRAAAPGDKMVVHKENRNAVQYRRKGAKSTRKQ